jgi:two-component system sensor histidine kinase CiaH
MIRKLRRKLVTASMLSLAAVLFAIIAFVGVIYYRRIVSYSDSVLSILEENSGRFPSQAPSGTQSGSSAPSSPPSGAQSGSSAPSSPPSGNTAPDASGTGASGSSVPPRQTGNPKNSMPQNGGSDSSVFHLFAEHDLNSPELPFETRYFSVLLNDAGEVASTDTGKIAAVDSSSAGSMAQSVLSTGKSRGFYSSYRYVYYTDDKADGDTRVIFIDCSRDLSSFRTILSLVILISVTAWAGVFLLLLILSRRIVRPFSDNYEKQKRFITDAGHDIKTPITVINADADVIEMESGGSEWLDDIRTQTKRMTELTNELIDLSRMEEGGSRLQLIDLPFSDLVSETASSFQAPAKEQGKTFTLQIQPMLSVAGDDRSLRRLVNILLDNAMKYSPENGLVTLSLIKQNRTVKLIIENTASYEITKETLSNMFDRFYRADASRTATGGYGIGLSIARSTMDGHHGKIQAESADGKTLRITCTFPAVEEKGH